MILYPGSGILGSEKYKGSLESGDFKKKLADVINAIRSQMDVDLFICTPLVWCEAGVHKTSVDGVYYKLCQQWAEQTRSVAEARGVALIDLHQDCVDYIEEHGPEKKTFAGIKVNSWWYEMTYDAGELVQSSVAKALRYNYVKP